MYSLTIHFGPNAMVWAFLFKEHEKAKQWAYAARNSTAPPQIVIEDDFGQIAKINTADIHGVLFEDLEQSEEARIQRSLAEARTRVKLEARAKTDPTIRQAMGAQGPGVLTPVPRFS